MLFIRKRRKPGERFLSTFLAFTLLAGSLTYSATPAAASDISSGPAVSDNDIQAGDDVADPANASAMQDDQADVDGTSMPKEKNTSKDNSEGMEDEADAPVSSDASEEPFVSDESMQSGSDGSQLSSDEQLSEKQEEPEEQEIAVETEEETDMSAIAPEELDQAQAGATSYTLTFDYNGGVDEEGNTSFQVEVPKGDSIAAYIKQAEEKNFISPYVFAYKWEEFKPDADTGELVPTDKTRSATTTLTAKANYTYKAVWNTTYASFDIQYELDGGSFYAYSGEYIPHKYTYVDVVTLPKEVQKKGYMFKGFYKDAAFKTGEVTKIPVQSMGNITLYARWESAKPKKTPVISKVTNPSNGKVKVTFKKVSGIAGYELAMSTDKKFQKNVNTMLLESTEKSVQLTNMPKGNTYYFKLRVYNMDSMGEKAYTDYSKVMKVKVTKGVQEYKATPASAKLKKCNVKKNTLTISYTVSKRVKSSDDSYYLVALNPYTDAYSKKIEQTIKQKTVTFTLPVRDEWGNDLIQTKFALAVKSGSKYKLISQGTFISNPEAAASYTRAFPKARSTKGLQMPQDANQITELGLSHTFINMDLNQVLKGANLKLYRYNGKTYYFNDAWGPTISALNARGVTVTGQIMLSYDESTKYMILKSGRTEGKLYYAINVKEKKARETFEAAMSFLAETYSKKDCHLDNWVLGNEVNRHPEWYYAGDISKKTFMKNYAGTFRIMYYAVRSHSKNSRVYICTDNTWSNYNGAWGAKPFMDAFNKEIKAQQEKIQWNLAYHAYPAVLTSAATWKDTLATDDVNTSYVSPKNLSVLTKYVKKNFGSKTRIILSEQGFTSGSGQDVQAAAILYTYYKAEFDPMIDAVIFRSDIDNSVESAQGLYLGLMDIYGNKKTAYEVFKYMDTAKASQYTKPYLKTIGISKWTKIAPKYTLSRFK